MVFPRYQVWTACPAISSTKARDSVLFTISAGFKLGLPITFSGPKNETNPEENELRDTVSAVVIKHLDPAVPEIVPLFYP